MLKHVALILKDEETREASESLAFNLSLPMLSGVQAKEIPFWLFYEGGILKLVNNQADGSGPVWVDFSKGKSAYRQKHQGKGKLPISRACGIKHNHRPRIIDATAGLGQDAIILAGLGCEVTCVEQQPVIAALLADGLERANQGDQWLLEIVARVELRQGLAEDVLATDEIEVVYLDPMYPKDQIRKKAKVNKGMQLFRAFPGVESNEAQLLNVARRAATDRVVVKRPDWASYLAGQEPSHQISGKNHRFDVYK